MEEIDITGDDAPARLILNAVSTFLKDDEFTKKFASHGPVAKVELLVNGHPVPVVASLADAWQRCQAEIDKDILEKAVELVKGTKLVALMEAIEHATWGIEEALKHADIDVESFRS